MKKKTSHQVKKEIKDQITQTIIDSLEKDIIPWRKPWSNDPNCGFLPKNILTGKYYRGINPLILQCSSITKGYKSHWWGTFKQFQKMGAMVKKGEKSSIIVWNDRLIFDEKDNDGNIVFKDDGTPKQKHIWLLKHSAVFNLEQVEDVDNKLGKYQPLTECSKEEVSFESAENLIKSTNAKVIYGGNSACYVKPIGNWPNHNDGDYIKCPQNFQFVKQEEFYATMFHELSHWSEVRLDYDDLTYAEGELIAEIASCYIAGELDIPIQEDMENHNSYIKYWLKKMKEDNNFIFQVAQKASKTADFLLGKKVKIKDKEKDLWTYQQAN